MQFIQNYRLNEIGVFCYVFLIAKDNEWAGLLSSLDMFSDDFMEEGRIQPEVQVREDF